MNNSTIIKDIQARKAHHADLLFIVDILLPNLSSLINEARLAQDTQMSPGSR